MKFTGIHIEISIVSKVFDVIALLSSLEMADARGKKKRGQENKRAARTYCLFRSVHA